MREDLTQVKDLFLWLSGGGMPQAREARAKTLRQKLKWEQIMCGWEEYGG